MSSFKVWFCFKFLGGIEEFDSLEEKNSVSLSCQITYPEQKMKWGEGQNREVRHKETFPGRQGRMNSPCSHTEK